MASILDSMSEIEKTAYRKIKLKEMQDYNQDFIDDLGISRSDFNMKYAFTRNGEIVVGVFANEFLKPKGFYFEIIDSNLNPVDTTRTIYRIPFNEFYEDPNPELFSFFFNLNCALEMSHDMLRRF